MTLYAALKIVGYGAWNGGTLVENAVFENKGMAFKGGISVTSRTIEDRIGVRTRMCAHSDDRIGQIALENLLKESKIEPSRIKLMIGATNVGEDKDDPGPLIKHPFQQVKRSCPNAVALDLYAGCPGYNVAVELVFMLSLSGVLKTGDISVIVGAENIHRAKAFNPHDTANIIFGDDALATALETRSSLKPVGEYSGSEQLHHDPDSDFIQTIAGMIFELNGQNQLDGIIIDNQLGLMIHRVPATAARVQAALVEMMYPEEASKGVFKNFKAAVKFYDRHINSFAFDIMSLDRDPTFIERVAMAYVESGKYSTIASVFLDSDKGIFVKIHKGLQFLTPTPQFGIIDTSTRTHGCFGDYIQAVSTDGKIFGRMDGKGVFLYATRGANTHVNALLNRNKITINDIELLIEHQANFAMIPMTVQQLLTPEFHNAHDTKEAVKVFVANKMIINIHTRGNCSVVCMQRLPYDLQRDTLKEDNIQGYGVNKNLSALKNAGLILNDSVGSGMTRSSFLQNMDIA